MPTNPSVLGKPRLLIILVKALNLGPRRPFHTMPHFLFPVHPFNRITLRRAEARALKPPHPPGDIDNRVGYAYVKTGVLQKVNVTSTWFCCEPKIVLKNNFLSLFLGLLFALRSINNNPYYLQTRSASGLCFKEFLTPLAPIPWFQNFNLPITSHPMPSPHLVVFSNTWQVKQEESVWGWKRLHT